MSLEFHRTPGGNININYNSLIYSDSAANLELDSSGTYADTIATEYQQWSEGKTCVIENGNQLAAPVEYQADVDAVLANLQTIIDVQTDREALANPEVQLSLNPSSILANGAATTTLTVQLVSGLKHDNSRENILQAGIAVQVLVTEPNGTQTFNFVTDANGQVTDTYDAVEVGTYIFEAISHLSVTTPQLTAT